MPGKVKVKIISGKNLPVMDRSSDTTDAYVEIKLGSTTYKTDVCRKSLHPQWNSEWYRFEVDDSELQDEPLQIRLMDHDTYSANDAIGKVYLNLNPLLLPAAGNLSKYGGYKNDSTEGAKNSVMSGWIPVYDTMHGIRGEVNIVVKVELFYDFNKFRQSSCGVQFFCSPTIPHGFTAQLIHGFVEELIVIDDPEYKWIDKIRTPRASNEARQTLFFKLSGELQRKIGVKALNLGGNAVIAYRQRFDLEGESGIVARGIGTAVTLVKCVDVSHSLPETVAEERVTNYLKFIGYDKNFRLSSKPNIAPLFPKPRPVPLNKTITKRPKYKQIAKHLSSDTAVLLRTAQSNPSLTDPSFQTLLKQEDRRGTPGRGLSQRIKNLKYSSHSSLSKKMTALKAKLGESGIGEERDEDVESPVSNRKGIFKRTQSENSVMAELLARSVINVHNSLGSVLEDKESSENEQADAPLMKTAKSEPNISSDENTSLKYSNSDSSESYEEESEDESVLNFDTISNIVSNVQNLERGNEKLHKQMSLPSFPLKSPAESFQGTFFFPLTPKDQLEIGSDFYLDNASSNKSLDAPTMENSNKSSDLAEKSLKDEATDTASLKSVKTVTEGTQTDFEAFSVSALPAETKSEPVSPSNTQIIPPVMMGSGIKSKGLFKTAMQTMLLEKVNIISTYSPPTSPTLQPDDILSVNESWQSRHFIPQKVNLAKLPKSNTSISLHDDYTERHNETVLGVPFTAITSLKINLKRRNSHPCISAQNSESDDNKSNKNKSIFVESANLQTQSCFSDSELHKDESKYHQKSSFSFLHLLKKSQSHQSLPDNKRHTRKFSLFKHKPRHEEFNAKKRFSFFHKRSSVDETDCGKGGGGKLSKLFHLKHDHSNQAPTNDPDNITDKESSVKITDKSPELADNQSIADDTEIDQSRSKISLIFDKSDQKRESLSNTEEKNVDGNFDTQLIPNRHNKLVRQESINIEIEQDSRYSCSINKQDAFRHNTPPPSSSTSTTAQSTCQTATEQNGTLKSSPDHTAAKMPNSPAKLNAVPCIHRRSSDSDLSITPKGFFKKRNSLTGSDRSGGGYIRNNLLMRSTVQQENFDMLEYPFLTMTKYPTGFILQLGGAVSARSVKLLERISNVEEPESRDTWWSEIRMEIRSHARSLNCNAVLGYTETTSICEDVCVLSASGTAAVVGFHCPDEIDDNVTVLPSIAKHDQKTIMTTSLDRTNFEKDKKNISQDSPDHNSITTISHSHHSTQNCIICHLPYDTNNLPVMRATIMKCNICSKGKVPDVLIATIEPPDNLPNIGRGCFIDSFICRPLKDLRGESIAKDISDGLPFLEYELHRLLVNKLKIKGMNAIFGLKIRLSVGEKMLIGIATGTAIYLESLPTPSLPKLVSDRMSDEKKLNELQKLLQETVNKNRDIYQLKMMEENSQQCETEESEIDVNSLDLITGNKDCCILEVDDPQDAEVVNLLMEERPPDGFHVVNTESVPGLDDLEIVKNLQMFTQIYRAKLHSPVNLNNQFRRLLQSVYFKLRRMVPCALCDLQFRINLPEPDEIQLCVVGMALGLGKCDKVLKITSGVISAKKNDDDLIFKLDEETSENGTSSLTISQSGSIKYKQKSPSKRHASIKQRHIPHKERHGVDITPLSYVPGGKIERYLGNLNFFFIRETTSIREEGGPSGFIHSFITEILAIVRAHVTALGGNALVAYFLTECVLNHNLHKNQGQCLINVGGDVVFVSYFKAAEDT